MNCEENDRIWIYTPSGTNIRYSLFRGGGWQERRGKEKERRGDGETEKERNDRIWIYTPSGFMEQTHDAILMIAAVLFGLRVRERELERERVRERKRE